VLFSVSGGDHLLPLLRQSQEKTAGCKVLRKYVRWALYVTPGRWPNGAARPKNAGGRRGAAHTAARGRSPSPQCLLAASAASFSSLLTSSSSSFAFFAWPPISHSFAACAALIRQHRNHGYRYANRCLHFCLPTTLSTRGCTAILAQPAAARRQTASIFSLRPRSATEQRDRQGA
jgi:hypothetical protein